MEQRRWVNQTQPQTLQIAVFLLYLTAVFNFIDLLRIHAFPLVFVAGIAGSVAAGYGIANERKWGYILGIVMALWPFGERVWYGGSVFGADIITLLFEVALVALLLHPQSRDYQRIWFK
ncbi:MAG: hypothetical protein JOZ68_07720 [Acidimicrobiia bacterium]|nr:hypothetical protein [Acidimicrobiia bacterium]